MKTLKTYRIIPLFCIHQFNYINLHLGSICPSSRELIGITMKV
jgi:hypothetical protein